MMRAVVFLSCVALSALRVSGFAPQPVISRSKISHARLQQVDVRHACDRLRVLHTSAADGQESSSTPDQAAPSSLSEERSELSGTGKRTLSSRVKLFFSGDGANRKKLASLGLYAILSYGFVSNASYAICLSVSWYLASKRSGLSPLAPGQWQFFLTIYGSAFLINNVIRPARLALSMALAPFFDKLIAIIMQKTGKSRGFATGVCVVFVNVIGTTVLMSSGIIIASIASGVPIWYKG